jgi:hypothetical protein
VNGHNFRAIIDQAHKGRGPAALVTPSDPLTDTRNELEAADMDSIAYPNAESINRSTSKNGGL